MLPWTEQISSHTPVHSLKFYFLHNDAICPFLSSLSVGDQVSPLIPCFSTDIIHQPQAFTAEAVVFNWECQGPKLATARPRRDTTAGCNCPRKMCTAVTKPGDHWWGKPRQGNETGSFVCVWGHQIDTAQGPPLICLFKDSECLLYQNNPPPLPDSNGISNLIPDTVH